MAAVMHILAYLKSAPGKRVLYGRHGHLRIEGFTDADWADDVTDRRSTSGYFTFVGGNLVTWRSKKQKVVSRSSAKAEYKDNPVQHDRTKHVEVDIHFIKEKLGGKIVSLPCVTSEEQLADVLTHAKHFKIRALKEKTEEIKTPTASSSSVDSAEEITKKYGLKAGLWKIFSSKEKGKEGEEKSSKGDEAKNLLAKYGGAYLATSITLSLISFSLCYELIGAGVDVQALLQKVGMSDGKTGEKVGTFALAYAAHKAASPIRFPPTVALTPVVARWI
ncbi:uncharacterized protein LOC126617034 [Malus sylvestris]|uniref:uncharacterized protein LOC126617034 n=1 Tax=Malus sylvestris TaxID=3752 RepID=UPI0021ACCDF9|nr:uncharacterized protein LOC126617034 [Malus sylvestris]